MGETAENVARTLWVRTCGPGCFALRSQQKAEAGARATLASEIVPVTVPGAKKGSSVEFAHDEFTKPDTSLEGLAKLRPAFRHDGKGSVTAGNSSGINDGAAALLVASETGARQIGLDPLARIVATANAGVEPRVMGIGPVPRRVRRWPRPGSRSTRSM